MNPFRKARQRDSDLEDEIRTHLRLAVADRIARGESREQAERAARLEFGNVSRVKEDVRDAWGYRIIDEFVRDLRHGLRVIRLRPGLSAIVILSLALGIAGATTLFSVVDAVLLHPYAWRDADRIVSVRLDDGTPRHETAMVTGQQLLQLRQLSAVEDVAATTGFPFTMTGQGPARIVVVQQLSANAFEFLGIPPVLGRGFTSADGPLGQEPRHVVVLGFAFWRSQFGGATDVIGKTIELNRVPYTIIGVAAPRFLPASASNADAVFAPLHLTLDPRVAWQLMIRLKPGVELSVAREQFQVLFEQFARDAPARFPRGFRILVSRHYDGLVATVRPALLLLQLATAFLLMIACMNAAILLIAGSAARRSEMAIRGSLGASKTRIFRQLFAEACLLAVSGVTLGVLLAGWGVHAAAPLIPANALPLVRGPIELNKTTLGFSAILGVIAAIVFATLPALFLTRGRVYTHLLAGRARVDRHGYGHRTRHVLVAAQVSLAVLLLAGCAAAGRSLVRLYQVSLGFDPRQVLTFDVGLPEGGYTDWQGRVSLFEDLRTRVASVPGVETSAVAVFTTVPPQTGTRRRFEIPGVTDSTNASALVQIVSTEYFKAFRMPIHRGTIWTTTDAVRGVPVAVVNDAFAERVWPGQDPIGQRFRLPDFKTNNSYVLAAPGDVSSGWLQVVGVVANSLNQGLREPPAPSVYVPYTLLTGDVATFAVRVAGNPLAIVPAVRERLRMIDSNLAVQNPRTVEQHLALIGWARERFVAVLLLGFAACALSLAAIGLYSVVAYNVGQRLREFGIRIALGARRRQVLRLALATTLAAVIAGLVVGIAVSILANRVLASWQVGNFADPEILGTISILMLVVAIAAAAVPAGRAAHIAPAGALRAE